MISVPLVDLPAHARSLQSEVSRAIGRVVEAGSFSGGPFVEQFEQEFAAFCGVPYAVGVGSGTEALWMSLLALSVGRGDEVIIVSNTFIATAEAITMTGAKPVFVDINPTSYTMDPGSLEEAITRRTRAIIPVHLYGQAADMDPIMEIARRHGLSVIEDACQAHGAEYRGARVGSIGDAGCFSFYPTKNLGAFGEAGAVTTHQRDVAERIRAFRDHGQKSKYNHDSVGWNGRMDGVQGAVLSVELPHLAAWNAARRAVAARYTAALAGTDSVLVPTEMGWGTHVYHIYAVRVPERDFLWEQMRARGVQCAVHYPVPIHQQGAYRHLGPAEGAFPAAEKCAGELLSLPMYPELTEEQVDHVVRSLRAALQSARAA